jgi:hypothetical protein
VKSFANFDKLILITICLFLISACAVNGMGLGFNVVSSTNQMGTVEHVKGYGVLLDTRSPSRSISIGEIDRYLLCPSAKQNLDSTLLMLSLPATTSFDSSQCQYGSALMRARTGLALDFSATHLRLLIGYQRHTIMRIKQDASSVFHVQFNSGEIARGEAIILIPEELNE